jgi:hypothetical protein
MDGRAQKRYPRLVVCLSTNVTTCVGSAMSARLPLLTLFVALFAYGCDGCDSNNPIKDDTGPDVSVDADGDGYTTDEDCDDSDPTVHPGADELCDEVDNDCDGEIDEGSDNIFYGDVDGDGYGDPDTTTAACNAPDGYVDNDLDCDDDDADIHPEADEICNDLDDDCDGLIDDEDDSLVLDDAPVWYSDGDGDGYGVDELTAQACEAPSGYVEESGDCDDENATIYPGADEYCNGRDDDCDGETDEDTVDAETRWYPDADGDGFGDPGEVLIQCSQPTGYVLDSTDCDDSDPSINPDANEYCDGADNDCDGFVDEDDAVDGVDWYADTDGDGYGDASDSEYACYQPTGYVADDSDCDDTDASQHPGAYEYCNGEDDDCDGAVDEDDAIDVSTWYADDDGDGYGDAATSDIDCDQPRGYVLDSSDCDDTDAAQYPGATEYCNGEDDDCDGAIDEDDAYDVTTWYADRDADGYGDTSASQIDCDQPTNYVADDTDCDDTDSTQYPGADEYCNGEDDDCDGTIDEDDALDVATWYEDLDGDTFGNDAVTDIDCDQPSGYVPRGGDCDDTDTAYNPGASETDCTDPADYNCDGSVSYADDDGDGYAACEECDDTDASQYPGADEYCNGEDDDCDGVIDEDDALDVATWYADSDGDRYGDATSTDIDCNRPAGYVANDADCDDTDAAQFPGAVEYCNGEDDDCDGTIDEDSSFDVSTWYADNDGDSYGDPLVTDIDCDQPRGYVADNTDCDDDDATQYPGATEFCNGEDDDCDGITDEDDAADVSTWYVDGDADGYGNAAISQIDCYQPTGYVADDSDCDDTDASQHPGADEYCNGEDDDCDGAIDEDDALDVATWYADTDSDGYGDAASTDIDCDQPTGYVADDSDCDDGDAAQYPGADEYCNGEDDDCDGRVDEDDALDVASWWRDGDGDSYGDPLVSDIDCDQPSGYVDNDDDCDDTDAMQHPGADEYCNGEDDDCDGTIDEDEAVDVATWYADSDSDSYGNPTATDIDCDQPSGYVADNTDCDDSDPAQYPGADEYCNGEDDDCDGTVDEDDALDVLTWYADSDSDGYGDAASTTGACNQPTGYVADATDCDDSDAMQYPGADEYCNGEDDDCDGTVDEDTALDAPTWYADTDSDGYGDPLNTDVECTQPTGYLSDSSDCDDSDPAQYPGADEYCNGEDDDCDGDIDEDGEVLDGDTYYADTDGDQAGDEDNTILACTQPSGYVDNTWDCDDSDATEPVWVDGTSGSSSGSGEWDDPYDMIQDGVDAATQCVLVLSGNYYEAVHLNGIDIELTGVDGAATTNIDATGLGEPALSIDAGETAATVIDGFTLTGDGHYEVEVSSYGCTSIVTCYDYYYTYCGGGLFVSASDPTIQNVIAANSSLPAASTTSSYPNTYYTNSMGGGMCFLDSASAVSGSQALNNFADQGGGIYADETTSLDLERSHVVANSATDGGGIEVDGGALATANTTSRFNEATAEGGGLLLIDANADLVNGAWVYDDGATGGILYASGTSILELTNSIVAYSPSGVGVLIGGSAGYVGAYSDVYGNAGGNYSGTTDPTGSGGNISAVPSFVALSDDGVHTNDDLHLSSSSPCVNAGNPSGVYDDADGSRNDMGAYGGPESDWE